FIDQTILSLSGGGLGVSLTFLHDFLHAPKAPYFLLAGDIFLIISIAAVLTSLLTSQAANTKYVRDLDKAAHNEFKPEFTRFLGETFLNRPAKWTHRLNHLAMPALLLGMMLIALFVYNNFPMNESQGNATMTSSSGIPNTVSRPTPTPASKGAVPMSAAVPKPAPAPQQSTPKP